MYWRPYGRSCDVVGVEEKGVEIHQVFESWTSLLPVMYLAF